MEYQYTHYHRRIVETGLVERVPFVDAHFAEAGDVSPRYLRKYGMPETSALRLVNKWNGGANYVYYLRPV